MGIQYFVQVNDQINPVLNGIWIGSNNAVELQVPRLRVQVTERLDKEQPEQLQKQQLLLLEES